MNNILQALLYLFRTKDYDFVNLDKKIFLADLNQLGISPIDLIYILAHISIGVLNKNCETLISQEKSENVVIPDFHYPLQKKESIRIFAAEEQKNLSKKIRYFLMEIEHLGILTPQLREDVIDKLMKIRIYNGKKLTLSRAKWTVFQTVINSSDSTPLNTAYLEWLLFSHMIDLH